MEWIQFIADVGFPIAAALAGGYFVFLTLKFILEGVKSSVLGLNKIILTLNDRVSTMNHDLIRIDTLMSNALGLKTDVERIARADKRTTVRKD